VDSVFPRFRRWVRAQVFARLFQALCGEPDVASAMIDGTIVTVHHEASGARGGAKKNAIGRSRGGLTSKIVALVAALGTLVRFVLLPGQRHDTVGVAPLIDGVSFDALLGDKAFDADWLRAELDDRGAAAVIPPRSNRKVMIDYDTEMYRWRHLVENYFAKIKEFRSIATRYDKTAESFSANINLAAALIAAR
jgi:transposase